MNCKFLTLLGTATTFVAAVASSSEMPYLAAAKARINASEGTLSAALSVRGAQAEQATWSENFDNGIPAAWNNGSTSYVTWTTKQIGAPGTAKSFSAIDHADVASLYVDGPYQTFRRETSSITSAPVAVGNNATLRFYVGMSLNYEDTSSLRLEASDDDFATATTLWFSREQTGDKPWAWRQCSASLEQFAGKDIKLRFTYGPGTSDNFNTGGYLGDYAIDGLTVMASTDIDNIAVTTGQKIDFVDISAGEPTSWQWTFPGGTPAQSTDRNPVVYYTRDGNYDVSLTVTDAAGNTSSATRTAFVSVTGQAPVAAIGLPATFRLTSNRLPLVAPQVPVVFTDASTGFPTSWKWTITDPAGETWEALTETYDFGCAYLHEHSVTLDVANQHGTSSATEKFTAEYSGTVTNLLPTDQAVEYFDLEGRGEFPGTNTLGITAYAEKFSAPSRPVMIDGAYVYFTRAAAEEVADQIANIGVHLYTCENGMPGRKLDSMWWSVFELDLPTATSLVGTAFPFTEAPIVSDEFFIVVDGFPAKSETCSVAFGMAKFRGEGNSAYMLKDGQWKAVSDYFPAGANHTSFLIQPSIHHSVMNSLEAADAQHMTFDHNGGRQKHQIFSYLGYQMPDTPSHDWFRMVHTPNGLTVDEIEVECDPLPAGHDQRHAELTLTDGASTLAIPIHQMRKSAATLEDATDGEALYYNLQGIRLPQRPTQGLYIRSQNGQAKLTR